MRSPRLALLLLLLSASGCELGPSTPCSRVVCAEGRVCEASTGRCLPPDGGAVKPDAATPDAGVVDAGPGACSPACTSGRCDVATNSCVECLSSADCSCPRSACDLSTKSCVAAPAVDAGAVVPGETCGGAPLLYFPPCQNQVTFRVDLSAFRDDSQGTCVPPASNGRDAVVGLSLPTAADVEVTAVAVNGTASQPVVYLRADACGAAELTCRANVGGPVRAKRKSVPAGTYGVFLDGYDSSSSGPVDVTVTRGPPTLPANEACESAAPLALGQSATVDLATADDDLGSSCNSEPGSGEVVYRVELPEGGNLLVRATVPDGGLTDSVLALRSTPCALAGSEVACRDRGISGEGEVLRVAGLDAGTYYLVAERYGASDAGALPLTLSVETATLPNDSCEGARLLTFAPGNPPLRFTVDPWAARDTTNGTCSGTLDPSPQAIYRLSLTQGGVVGVTAQGQAGSGADVVLYAREGSCAGAELACADRAVTGAETLQLSLGAGDTYLFVEAYDPLSAGPIDVTLTFTP